MWENIKFSTKEGVCKNLHAYGKEAFLWQSHENDFPFMTWTKNFLLQKITRLYGNQAKEDVENQWKNHFICETGSHLGLFKSRDRITQNPSDTDFNTIMLQGLLCSVALHKSFGSKYHISLPCDWTPLSSAYSFSYLEKDYGQFIRLYSNHYRATPHFLAPPLSQDQVSLFATPIQSDLTTSEQMNVLSSYCINELLHMSSIKHLSLDLENVGRMLFFKLLDDKNCLTYKILNDPDLFDFFHRSMVGVPTAWKDDECVFDAVVEKNGTYSIHKAKRTSFKKISDIKKDIEDKEIILSVPFIVFILIVEAGMLPMGGANQILYCQRIQEIGVSLLTRLGEIRRAKALGLMPLSFNLYNLAWQFDKDYPHSVINYGHFLEKKLVSDDAFLRSLAFEKSYQDLCLGGLITNQNFLDEKVTEDSIRQIKHYFLSKGF